MLTKGDIKFVKSLGEKVNRYANKLFVAEGSKSVLDLLASGMEPAILFALDDWLMNHGAKVPSGIRVESASTKDLEQMSGLKSTREVIGVFKFQAFRFEPSQLKGLVLALDGIQDPGNLGTLIRLADWYGIQDILCSVQTVDCYNNKVVQATMGSLGRIRIHYGELSVWFQTLTCQIYAADMEGENSRKTPFPENCVLLIGNEGSGISAGLQGFIHKTICIERLGAAESLNAAVAGAILVDRYYAQHAP